MVWHKSTLILFGIVVSAFAYCQEPEELDKPQKLFELKGDIGGGFSSFNTLYIRPQGESGYNNYYACYSLHRPFFSLGIEYKRKLGIDLSYNLVRNYLSERVNVLMPSSKIYGIVNTGIYSRFIFGLTYDQFFSADRTPINLPSTRVYYHGLGVSVGCRVYGFNIDFAYLKFLSNSHEVLGYHEQPEKGFTIRVSYNILGIPNMLKK